MRSRLYLYPFIILLFVDMYYYYLKVAQLVILPCSDLYLTQFWSKIALLYVFNSCVTDGRTDGRTDGPTDGQTDGRTDGRRHPLIEMRERI